MAEGHNPGALLNNSAVIGMAGERSERIRAPNGPDFNPGARRSSVLGRLRQEGSGEAIVLEQVLQASRKDDQKHPAESVDAFPDRVADRSRAAVMMMIEAEIPWRGILPTFHCRAW